MPRDFWLDSHSYQSYLSITTQSFKRYNYQQRDSRIDRQSKQLIISPNTRIILLFFFLTDLIKWDFYWGYELVTGQEDIRRFLFPNFLFWYLFMYILTNTSYCLLLHSTDKQFLLVLFLSQQIDGCLYRNDLQDFVILKHFMVVILVWKFRSALSAIISSYLHLLICFILVGIVSTSV